MMASMGLGICRRHLPCAKKEKPERQQGWMRLMAPTLGVALNFVIQELMMLVQKTCRCCDDRSREDGMQVPTSLTESLEGSGGSLASYEMLGRKVRFSPQMSFSGIVDQVGLHRSSRLPWKALLGIFPERRDGRKPGQRKVRMTRLRPKTGKTATFGGGWLFP